MTPKSHFKNKLQKSVLIWEHLPKVYYFWTIIKQKMDKSVTIWGVAIWGHGLFFLINSPDLS